MTGQPPRPTSYWDYIRVEQLLGLQNGIAASEQELGDDEVRFIVIHQIDELWFKLVLRELVTARNLFAQKPVPEDALAGAVQGLRRVTLCFELAATHFKLMETMRTQDYLVFRDKLNPASGFQSFQFRKMEFIFGLRDSFFLKYFDRMPEYRKELEQLSKDASVRDDFLACLKKNGFKTPASLPRDASSPEFTQLIKEVYEKPGENYHWVILFESLIDFDEKLAHWRSVHMLMVERTIGFKRGTGGSAGHSFLKMREHLRCFPELWDVRNLIGNAYGVKS